MSARSRQIHRFESATVEQLLNCPRIEDGEPYTLIYLYPGAFAEIARRLRAEEHYSSLLKRRDASPSGRGNVSRDIRPYKGNGTGPDQPAVDNAALDADPARSHPRNITPPGSREPVR